MKRNYGRERHMKRAVVNRERENDAAYSRRAAAMSAEIERLCAVGAQRTRTLPKSKSEIAYCRDRDAGRCTVGQFTTAHVAVLTPDGALHIEVLTENVQPRWLTISPRMRPNEIEKEIRKSATISPILKTTYLQMLEAGKEVR